MISTLLAQTTQTLFGKDSLWLPPGASTVSGDTDTLLNVINWITIFFTVLIFVLMIVFVIKYRHKPGRKAEVSAGHSTSLELTWTLIPTIIVVILFYAGFRQYLKMVVVPPNTYEIQADAYMWGWNFTYPNGWSSNELHVPEGVPVRMVLTSKDVIHALYIPNLRLQKSNVPGRYNRLWFEATFVDKQASQAETKLDKDNKPIQYTEEHEIYCNQYCGQDHSEMRSKLVVHRREDYEGWLKEHSDWRNAVREGKWTPLEQGEKIYHSNGCASCHSVDGSANTGPTWKDLFGRKATYDGGIPYTADEDYIRESILIPDAHIVDGFKNVMPPFKGVLKDYDIDAVIIYMKSISKNWNGGDPNRTFKMPTDSAAPGAAPTMK
jgi:cytochrome c oxidase subunit 2